jgi:hypothetical protein
MYKTNTIPPPAAAAGQQAAGRQQQFFTARLLPASQPAHMHVEKTWSKQRRKSGTVRNTNLPSPRSSLVLLLDCQKRSMQHCSIVQQK